MTNKTIKFINYAIENGVDTIEHGAAMDEETVKLSVTPTTYEMYEDDSFVLEVNNDNGEVLAVEYMDKKHIKFADSLYDLFMNSTPIWYQD